MSLATFELTSRQSLLKTSGIVLDKDLLSVYQSIEQSSTRSNLSKAMIFSPNPERISALKLTPERFREAIKDLVEFKLVAQVFEVSFLEERSKLGIATYFLCATETLRNPEESYGFFLERSAKEILRYCKESNVADPNAMQRIAYNLGSGNSSGFGSGLQYLFAKGSFSILPPDSLVNQFKADLKILLEKHNELIGDLDSEFHYVPEEHSSAIFNSFRSEFESRILPNLRNQSTELNEKVLKFEEEESVNEKNIDYKEDWTFLRNVCRACLEYPKLLGESGRLLTHTIVKLSILAENHQIKLEKSERDRQALKCIKDMDGGKDIESLFPRVNLEDPDDMPKSVVDALRIDREILHVEWYTPNHKLIVFAKKKTETLMEINRIIYEKFCHTTEYPLYFRALLEANEKDVYEVFQRSEFVKIYGKSLQATYLRYIPFFYKIFAWLGIRSLINAGYVKAKSIIKYNQMERQFQYEKRYEKLIKERLQMRLENLAKKELMKYKIFLINALKEIYFFEQRIPNSEEIAFQYPALTPVMQEKVCKEFEFGVVQGEGGFAGENLIFFPASPEYEEKNRELRYLTDDILSGSVASDEGIKTRASLLKELLP
ncbi:MAG: hypothetical protein JJT78_16490 [Leptospira sp.]|nr:hypothetical protein [Leptospira sp.]